MRSPAASPSSTWTRPAASDGRRWTPFEREDRNQQGVAGEGVAVDADGTVFAAEGPNSFVQAGGAYTKYSAK